jgi:hypothetical protein
MPFFVYEPDTGEQFLVCENCYDDGHSNHNITKVTGLPRTAYPALDRVCHFCQEFV